MAQNASKPDVTWSKEGEIVLPRIRTLHQAMKTVWRDWERILKSAGAALREEGYEDRVYIDPGGRFGHLQIAAPHWPRPFCSAVHFEIGMDEGMLLDGEFAVWLDVEASVEGKQAVIDCLNRVLKPYRLSGLLQKSTRAKPVSTSPFHVLENRFPLVGTSARQIVDAVRPMLCLATVVDESLFVRDGEPLWRTDFLPGDPKPKLNYSSSDGGQRFQSENGRMGSPSLLVDGSAPGNHRPANDRPTHIARLTFTHQVNNGDQIYLSCVLRTATGGRLWFLADVPKKEGGVVALFESPHWLEIPVPGKPDWQHVGFRAQVRTPADYDFRERGASMYLRTQTDDPGFTFNSIEFGRCRQQEPQP